jgi:phospholipase C
MFRVRHVVRVAALVGGLVAGMATPALVRPASAATPIKHVVIIYQENHSFDNVLGYWCTTTKRCNGARQGTLPNGTKITLSQATDIVPNVDHTDASQTTAIDGGKMDGFAKITGCTQSTGYACYTQYRPAQIPNLIALANAFAVSDETFSMQPVPSFGAHLELVAQTLDGFTGDNPHSVTGNPAGPGWGCDSFRDAHWQSSPISKVINVPACVPAKNGTGPYRASPVKWVPTIMDRLSAKGISWRLYAGTTTGVEPNQPQAPDIWSICPYFADCRYTNQWKQVVLPSQITTDAAAGTLPSFSVLLPYGPSGPTSQHNFESMSMGDNWIGQVVQAIENGPDWTSTAIFITYDDCGCFYDHVAPPLAGLGIREPMVIVSPYARPGFTDSTTATFSSMLAYVEHTFGVAPLTSADKNAYDFSNAFNYSQTPLPPVQLHQTPISMAERRFLFFHPSPPDTT